MNTPKPIFLSLRLFLTLSFMASLVVSVDPGEDFAGYMENLEERRQDEEAYRHRLHEHEIWRQTTWGGWTVRQLQAIGNHFAPFFEALSDAIAAEGDTAGSMALLVLLRILLVGAFVLAAYAFSRILNMILGQELVIEEEVIVVESDDEDEDGKTSEKKKDK